MTSLILHLPPDWVTDRAAMLPFYRKLTDGLDAAGVPWQAVALDRDTALAQIEQDQNFHIINHGKIRHPRALNAGIAYIYPFWNLDPQGIRAFSSIAELPFRAGKIDSEAAQKFFARLRKRLVEARISRYEQPAEAEVLPAASAAVFFQSETHRTVGETCYMDRWQMLSAVLEASDGPVIVKPHPREIETAVFERLLQMQETAPQLVISLANIHDILAASARVVTINSAVGIEAYLHRKPVILCGHTDFHHIATTARSPDELRAALQAPAPARQYAKYLYWYFGQNCINAGGKVADQVLRRVRATGFEI